MRSACCFALFCAITIQTVAAIPSSAQGSNADNEPIAVSRSPLPRGMTRMPGQKLPVPFLGLNTKIGAARPGELVLPVPDNSLWFRYYKAGEAAKLKNDQKLAMKYWMASLAALEKVKPNPDDDLMSVKLSALEQALTYSYPADWSKVTEPEEKRLKWQEEQVSTLLRMSQINRRLVPSDKLLCAKSLERYSDAKRSYDKAIAENKPQSN